MKIKITLLRGSKVRLADLIRIDENGAPQIDLAALQRLRAAP